MYIYTYIYRERERERERMKLWALEAISFHVLTCTARKENSLHPDEKKRRCIVSFFACVVCGSIHNIYGVGCQFWILTYFSWYTCRIYSGTSEQWTHWEQDTYLCREVVLISDIELLPMQLHHCLCYFPPIIIVVISSHAAILVRGKL